jgi:hypothetical protein
MFRWLLRANRLTLDMGGFAPTGILSLSQVSLRWPWPWRWLALRVQAQRAQLRQQAKALIAPKPYRGWKRYPSTAPSVHPSPLIQSATPSYLHQDWSSVLLTWPELGCPSLQLTVRSSQPLPESLVDSIIRAHLARWLSPVCESLTDSNPSAAPDLLVCQETDRRHSSVKAWSQL